MSDVLGPAARTSSEAHELVLEARRILDDSLTSLDQLKGKKVRVIRAVVFEGDPEAVVMQLARSMAPGKHFHNGRRLDNKSYGEYTITIAGGAIEVVE